VKLSVEFPSVAYREGAGAILRCARAIEQIGYDGIDVFDHVVMGYPIAGRPLGPYPPTMPILEALMTLSFVAAVTSRVTLGTEVLVLPQRHPTLVAKQVSTLDTLSGGRVRLGVGVGWQESEYEALGQDFRTRGARMDEAIWLLRAYWSDARVDVAGPHYRVTAMGMEPKPPQGRRLPIWIGGMSEPAWRRVTAGWRAASPTPTAPDAPSTPSAATPKRRAAIPPGSGCTAWSCRLPGMPKGAASMPSMTAWSRASSTCMR
jgi:probable F420-dependent oxidoreductase